MNIMCGKSFLLLVFTFFLISSAVQAQEIEIELGPDEIAENQSFTITITVSNNRLKSYDNFPDIQGFRKRGTSSSSSTNIFNGQISSTQSVTMTYTPDKQGTYVIKPFSITVNGQKISSPGKRVRVGPPIERRQRRDPLDFFSRDSFHDPFGRKRETTFVDIKEDAFLALTTDQKEIYVGEGVTTTLAFYVADNNRAPLQFFELGKQLSDILKKVRPANCWEENFNIENINGEPVTINNKQYTQFKIYQATFYPFNNEDLTFPSVGLEMIKYKVAKNPSFFGQNRKEDFKTFYSRARKVKVKDLPPHPLRDVVAVGDYRLDEEISTNEIQTGESVAYDFNIYGEGNISAIEKPKLDSDKDFDFYDPDVSQKINRRNDHVTGYKSFEFYAIPKEPGEYNFGDYFQWIFFNPKTAKYDTLKSEQKLLVRGESKKNENISSSDVGSFYDRMDAEDNRLASIHGYEWTKIAINIFILILLAASAFVIFRLRS
ncbi:MAG: BatD family protein [Bacteroidota bacterium]